jgi:hypothetical protein
VTTPVSRIRIALGLATTAMAVAVAVAVLLVISRDGAATPAAAHPSPADGCSFAPDSGPWFNFHNACDRHDLCYIGHWTDKLSCDYRFLQDMRNYCYGTYQWWQWQRAACLATAWTYYTGVSTAGWACYLHWIPFSNTCR